MSAANSTGSFLLRWSKACDSTFHEHLVEVISSQPTETVLRSPISVQEHTKVLLLETKSGGIVQSCHKEGSVFILTISAKDEINRFSSESQRDPGPMVVDNFLSEAQEAELLKHWND